MFGTGSGTFGSLFFGYDIDVTGVVLSGQMAFSVNGQNILVQNLDSGGNQMLGPLFSAQALNTWAIELNFLGLPGSTVTFNNIFISEFPLGNGSSQGSPLPPTGGGGGTWIFNNVPSGLFFDPPFANGFEYTGTSGTTFTQITTPTGFASPFTILYGPGFANSTGPVNGGATVDFTALGGAVDAFRVTGIDPTVDAANALAFPLQIFFSNSTGSFTQTPLEAVPEPGTWGLAAATLLGLAGLRWRAASGSCCRG